MTAVRAAVKRALDASSTNSSSGSIPDLTGNLKERKANNIDDDDDERLHWQTSFEWGRAATTSVPSRRPP